MLGQGPGHRVKIKFAIHIFPISDSREMESPLRSKSEKSGSVPSNGSPPWVPVEVGSVPQITGLGVLDVR